MASHCFQYIYVGFNGFRWPVAYFRSHNVNGNSIYLTFWPIIQALNTYGVKVHVAMMDGSSNNHQYVQILVKPENACMLRYTTHNPYNCKKDMSVIQDCKHVIKKSKTPSWLAHLTKSCMPFTNKGKPI